MSGGGVIQRQTRLQGAIDVATAALGGGLGTIEAVHTAIACKPFSMLRLAPGVGGVSEVVRVIHDGVTAVVYAGLGTAVAAMGRAAQLVSALTPTEEPQPGPLSDVAVAALNGFAGERLVREGNPLATQMGLRHRGRNVPLDRDALATVYPDASPRLAVFVHGLACNERLWQLSAERHYGDREASYGSRLQADLGYTPLYVRYNSGLHVSDNGRQLARLLDRAVRAWPVRVDELVLIGHSMGGLVVRSACHYGQQWDHDWVRRVRHVVFLGSPHLGAPLEKAANVTAWLLGLVDITRPFADALNARSAGIKDLRFGALLDEHWQDVDLDALLADHTGEVPLLEGAAHYFVAATVTRDARHPLGVAVGDLLVRPASAFGRGRVRRIQFPLEHGRHFGPLNHFELLNHPGIYEQMRRWLAASGEPSAMTRTN